MARIVSFVALVVILVVIGGLFLQVMAGFLLPLFLALLLVLMFGPLHRWFARKCGLHGRIAAVLTTGSILALVLVPMLLLLCAAGREAQSIYHAAMNSPDLRGPAAASDGKDKQPTAADLSSLVTWGTDQLIKLSNRVGIQLQAEDVKTNLDKAAKQFVAPLALRTTQFLGQASWGCW